MNNQQAIAIVSAMSMLFMVIVLGYLDAIKQDREVRRKRDMIESMKRDRAWRENVNTQWRDSGRVWRG